MRDDLDQEAQLEALKGFWKSYRLPILALLAAVVVGVVGHQAYQRSEARGQQEASAILGDLQNALEANDLDAAKAAGALLVKEHSGRLQAALGAMGLGRALFVSGEAEAAVAQFALAARSDEPGVAWLGRVRQASVLLDLDRAREGLALLEGNPPEGLAPLVFDRRGDLQAFLGQREAAQTSWNLARARYLASEGPNSPAAALISRKLATVALWPEINAAAPAQPSAAGK